MIFTDICRIFSNEKIFFQLGLFIMQKLLKIYILATVLSLLLFCLAITAVAAEYQDTLRVGIYYGGSTVDSLNLESDVGFALGYTTGRDFYEFDKTDATDVTIIRPNE